MQQSVTRSHSSQAVALKSLRRRARAGELTAIWELGVRHEDGVRDPNGSWLLAASPRAAANYFKRAADGGHAPSMLALANLMTKGHGIRRNLAAVLRLERAAARRGESSAPFNLAISYRLLGKHLLACRWLEKAIIADDHDALLLRAKYRLAGVGTRRDTQGALGDLRRVEASWRVSEAEREEARLLLAWVYLDGMFVQRNQQKALTWLRKASKHRSAIADAVLASLGESGPGESGPGLRGQGPDRG